jgi:hypothetical protein
VVVDACPHAARSEGSFVCLDSTTPHFVGQSSEKMEATIQAELPITSPRRTRPQKASTVRRSDVPLEPDKRLHGTLLAFIAASRSRGAVGFIALPFDWLVVADTG